MAQAKAKVKAQAKSQAISKESFPPEDFICGHCFDGAAC
jgi:hypothetical protein